MEYLRIRGGKVAQKVSAGTKHSQVRKFSNPKTGEGGEAIEVNHDSVTGVITGIEIKEMDWGELCEITLENAIGEVFISKGEFDVIELGDAMITIPTDSKELFNGVAERLPRIDMSKKVKFRPYAFTPEGSEYEKRGVTIYQDGEKIESNFWGKKKNRINGFPKPENPEKMDKEDWKIYFIQCKKFLVKLVKGMSTIPKDDSGFEVDKEAQKDETATIEDLPF